MKYQCSDIRYMDKAKEYMPATAKHKVSLLDEDILGAFKIERLIRDGKFLGAKQYMMYSWSEG